MDSLKKQKKRKRRERAEEDEASLSNKKKKKESKKKKKESKKEVSQTQRAGLNFPHKYILAPMVGASELAFRLLCRQYGTELAYTPMMSAHKFAHDEDYRRQEFQTCAADRPLVCHFCANEPQDFADAARAAAPYCDAIDLNLGCPQRTAYLGHFGSYLLDGKDRQLVCSIVRAGAQAVSLPIFCKIRLLDTLEETIELCRQLQDSGASLIAIHARYRASWERKGPGARDGPALLEQVTEIKKHLNIPVITNGNTITYDDVVQNLKSTAAAGLMSAEGILDNPALFLPRLGKATDTNKRVPLILPDALPTPSPQSNNSSNSESVKKKERKLNKKLREISRLEKKMEDKEALTEEEEKKLSKKAGIEKELHELQVKQSTTRNETAPLQSTTGTLVSAQSDDIALSDLYKAADNKLQLAHQYLDLATQYPVKIRSVVFHTRRMLKDLLTRYQLLETCLAAETLHDVRAVLHKLEGYQRNPSSFVFDKQKEQAQKEALERKKREEGKRKAFEARMIRKAKREGKSDLQFYLHQGAEVPSKELVHQLRQMPRSEALVVWKKHHSQHCLAFHLDASQGCTRGRACAFLHVDVLTSNTFHEQDEVAG